MLAIIPARGGSKGLPGKNIRLLNGKPLIAHTILAALKSYHISRVIVSTDDEEIASIAKQYGAEIPFMRPEFLATDHANAIDVYKYIINRIENDENTQIEDFIVLQPTSPLRNEKHIDEAIAMFKANNADSVISFTEENHPIFWHKFVTPNGQFEEIFQGEYLKNRQELKKTYYPNGAIYIFRTNILLQSRYYTQKSYAYLMKKKCSIDIDSLEDFEYAQWIMKNHA